MRWIQEFHIEVKGKLRMHIICKEKGVKKYSIIDGFMYVCVSRKCEMMEFFRFFINSVFFEIFHGRLKKRKMIENIRMYVCIKQNPPMME